MTGPAMPMASPPAPLPYPGPAVTGAFTGGQGLHDGSPPPTPPVAAAPSVLEPRAPRDRARGSTDANPIASGMIAAIVFGITAALKPALEGTYVGDLVFHRGFVQYAILALTCWATGILVVKATIYFLVQRRAFSLDLLPNSPHRITRSVAAQFVGRFAEMEAQTRGFWARRRLERSVLSGRLRRALEHFQARGSTQELASLLTTQSETDAAAVESSYTMVKVLIWAIPILGFIGTVVGIGAAVGGFSESIKAAQEIDLIKESLGNVTTGLAVAFDTTLLALVMSIFIMVPTSRLQKAEDDLVGSVDDFASNRLLRRLQDDQENAPTERLDASIIEAAIARSMAEHEAELRQRTAELRGIAAAVADDMRQAWAHVHAQVAADLGSQQRAVTSLSTALAEGTARAEARVGALEQAQQAAVLRVSEGVAAELRGIGVTVGDDLRRTWAQVHGQIATDLVEQQRAVTSLSAALIESTARAEARVGALEQAQQAAVLRVTEGLSGELQGLTAVTREQGREQHAVARQLLDAIASSRAELTQAAQTELQQVSAVGNQLAAVLAQTTTQIAAVPASLEHAAVAQQAMVHQATDAATDVLSRRGEQLGAVAEHIAQSLAGQAASLGERVEALGTLLERTAALHQLQQQVTRTLDDVARTHNLQETLAGLNATLNGLTPLLRASAEAPLGEPRKRFRLFGRS